MPASASILRKSFTRSLPEISQWVSLSYEPSTFQAATSTLGRWAGGFVHEPFKSRVLVSHIPPTLWDISLTGFQSQMPKEFVFPI